MKKGEVICSPRYEFPDGNIADKYLISLNDPAPDEPYLILLTTSQERTYRVKIPGCHSKQGYYVIPKGADFFYADFTWVPFETLREVTLKDELREGWKGNFITKAVLKPNTLQAIINCLKQSNYITKHLATLLK